MKARRLLVLLTAVLTLAATTELQAQKIKVIVDQDARGPATPPGPGHWLVGQRSRLPHRHRRRRRRAHERWVRPALPSRRTQPGREPAPS